MTFQSRVTEARASSLFARIMESTGTVTHKVHLPGHDGRRYLVLMRHEARVLNVYVDEPPMTMIAVLTGECLLDLGNYGTPKACPSTATANFPCYHTISACTAIARASGLEIAWSEDEHDAKRLKNLHVNADAKAFRVGQHNGFRYVWATTWRKQ